MIRRAVLAALAPEFDSLERRLAEEQQRTARFSERAGAMERGLGGLVGKLDEAVRLSDHRMTQLDEALAKADTRLNQLEEHFPAAAPVRQTLEEIRQAVLAVRSEFEALRDQRVQNLERRVDEMAGGGLGALQREMEGLRDQRVPEVEKRLDAISEENLGPLQREVERLRDERVPRLEQSADEAHRAIDAVQGDVAELRDSRVSTLEIGAARLQESFYAVQESLAEVRDRRLPELAADLAGVQRGQEGVQQLAEEIRDQRLPAMSGRFDTLLARLHEELTATAGLVDRILAGEPLHVQVDESVDVALPGAFRDASTAFMDEFRGDRDEIGDRVCEYLPLLTEAGPVLDLGCGRGELLAALSGAGVEATGVDGDPAMVEACQRSGLAAKRADLLEHLQASEPGTYGAITAVHVLEHLPAAVWMSAIEAAAKALRRGGLLIVECPNPEALRVGGSLFWIDPTHRMPVHPDSVAFVARAVGLKVLEVRYRRPFPSDQCLAREGQSPEVRQLAEQLDAWLSGPRDFAVIARKP